MVPTLTCGLVRSNLPFAIEKSPIKSNARVGFYVYTRLLGPSPRAAEGVGSQTNAGTGCGDRTQKSRRFRKSRKRKTRNGLLNFCDFCVAFAPFASGCPYPNYFERAAMMV